MSSETPKAELNIPGQLRVVAKLIESEAGIASRPGQTDRLEALANDVRMIARQIEAGAFALRGEV